MYIKYLINLSAFSMFTSGVLQVGTVFTSELLQHYSLQSEKEKG